MTISVGAAVLMPGERNRAEQLLEAAGRALYQAKTAGRDTWKLYTPPPPVRLVSDTAKPEE